MDKENALSKIEELLKKPEQTFVLSTLTDDGYPDSRIMGNICDKSIHEVYFTCRTGTRKTNEITKNPRASVYFTSDTITVWLYGDSSVTRDEGERKKIWNDKVLQLYSEGVDSPRLTVIRFVPKKVRILEKMSTYIEFDL